MPAGGRLAGPDVPSPGSRFDQLRLRERAGGRLPPATMHPTPACPGATSRQQHERADGTCRAVDACDRRACCSGNAHELWHGSSAHGVNRHACSRRSGTTRAGFAAAQAGRRARRRGRSRTERLRGSQPLRRGCDRGRALDLDECRSLIDDIGTSAHVVGSRGTRGADAVQAINQYNSRMTCPASAASSTQVAVARSSYTSGQPRFPDGMGGRLDM